MTTAAALPIYFYFYFLQAEVQGKSKVTTVQPLIHHLNEEEFLMALTGSERTFPSPVFCLFVCLLTDSKQDQAWA